MYPKVSPDGMCLWHFLQIFKNLSITNVLAMQESRSVRMRLAMMMEKERRAAGVLVRTIAKTTELARIPEKPVTV